VVVRSSGARARWPRPGSHLGVGSVVTALGQLASGALPGPSTPFHSHGKTIVGGRVRSTSRACGLHGLLSATAASTGTTSGPTRRSFERLVRSAGLSTADRLAASCPSLLAYRAGTAGALPRQRHAVGDRPSPDGAVGRHRRPTAGPPVHRPDGRDRSSHARRGRDPRRPPHPACWASDPSSPGSRCLADDAPQVPVWSPSGGTVDVTSAGLEPPARTTTSTSGCSRRWRTRCSAPLSERVPPRLSDLQRRCPAGGRVPLLFRRVPLRRRDHHRAV